MVVNMDRSWRMMCGRGYRKPLRDQAAVPLPGGTGVEGVDLGWGGKFEGRRGLK